jgi:hypothetical protein
MKTAGFVPLEARSGHTRVDEACYGDRATTFIRLVAISVIATARSQIGQGSGCPCVGDAVQTGKPGQAWRRLLEPVDHRSGADATGKRTLAGNARVTLRTLAREYSR